jgi:mono/diheme cytochrome c family protein
MTFALLVSPATAFLSNASDNQPIYEEITRLLKNNPDTGKPVQTIEEWLPLLPPELRANFTFVYQSRSPHGELEEKAVDPLHPRIILFTPDGKVTVALNGKAGAPGYNKVQLIQFIDSDARFEFSEYLLPQPGSSAFEDGAPNPPSCLRCHGQDPRPVTDSYPLWPGFYGSVRDTFPTNSPELPLYRQFLADQAGCGPYRLLTWPTGTSVPPYLDPKDYDSQAVKGKVDFLRLLPNTRLGMAWTELNRKRIQRKLEASSLYPVYRYALLAGFLGCGSIPVSQQDVQHTRESLLQENADRLQRLGYRADGPEGKTLDMMELGLPVNVAAIEYLANSLKLDRSDWSLAYEVSSLSFYDGILPRPFGDRNYLLLEDFILEMLRQLSNEDASFRPYFQTYGAYKKHGYPFGERLNFEFALKACERLKQMAETNLPLPVLTTANEMPQLPDATTVAARAGLTKAPFARCTRCHEGTVSLLSGRKIPFNRPTLLREALHGKAKSGRSLFDEIIARVSSRGSDQMPPASDPFTEAEARNLKAYLLAVRNEL